MAVKGSSIGGALGRARRASVRAFARLPRPARLFWIFLAILGGYAVAVDLKGLGPAPLLLLPLVAVLTDLLFQRFRFKSYRAPDAPIATGLLLALLLPPTVNLLQAASVTVAAVTTRHALRYKERPVLNPAAFGVIIGAIAFGMAPAWWGSIEVRLVVLLGIVLTLRTPGSWRLPVSFLAANALLSPLGSLLLGQAISPQLLLLRALDPALLFFGLFMVAEPRTSLSKSADRWLFGIYVAGGTVFLPALLPTLAPLAALLMGNVMSVAILWIRASSRTVEKHSGKATARRNRRKRLRHRSEEPSLVGPRSDWRAGRMVAAGALAFAFIGALAISSGGQSQASLPIFHPGTTPPPPSGTGTRSCSQDNASIPSDVLSFLHGRLGSSVILSYDSNSGTTVFYDPVNKVTVTETDMYEDFGYAEFNGDDYAVAGCSA